MSSFPWISALTLLPVLGSVAVMSARHRPQRARFMAVAFAGAALLLCGVLWHGFDLTTGSMQFQELYPWVPALNIEYHVGVDGLGVLMLLLSAIVVLVAMAASWKLQERVGLYFTLVLLLQACLFGAFTALNFIHWFTFWELSLIPAFFLIKLWGGPRSGPAATQFLVYTLVGSVAMLLAFVALYLGTGSFDFLELARLAAAGQLMPRTLMHMGTTGLTAQHMALLLFCGAFLGFAVKVPVVPFHTWLPSAYAEAPTGTTVLLTGALSKMGLYGFLRVLLPIFAPQMREMLTPLLWLSVASIVLSSFAALAQKDLKKIFAYSSINHLGYCVLALLATVSSTGTTAALWSARSSALSGAMLQMFNHGLTAATLFWFLALLEARSGGLRGLEDFGGLRKVAPVLSGLMGIALFSSLGLPGLNGFIGEFLIFRGSFPLAPWATSLALIGLLITALFILGVLQRVFSGPLPTRWSGFPDLTRGERLLLAPVIALMFVLGLYPQVVLGHLGATVVQLLHQLPI